MNRRSLISLLGGAAAASSLSQSLRAQTQAAKPVIGFLNPTSADSSPSRNRGWRLGLKDAGYVEGENVAVEYRWADGQIDRLPDMASELVRRRVVVSGVPAFSAVKAATTTIPIVFIVAQDPVALGLVASLARPGGTTTGFNYFGAELAAKRMELLRELAPAITRVAVLVNPANATTSEATLRGAESAARLMGLQIQVFNASSSGEITAAFVALSRVRPDALFVDPDSFLSSRRVQLVHLATHHAIPAIYGARAFVEAGGLMSYGVDLADAYRWIGAYTGRILKGISAADLPVVQANKFELVINAQAVKLLGLTVPPVLLASAHELIE